MVTEGSLRNKPTSAHDVAGRFPSVALCAMRGYMRPHLVVTAFLVLLLVMGLGPDSTEISMGNSAWATLVRIEVGDSRDRGVPASFDALLERVEQMGFRVTWTQTEIYDAHLSGYGGGTYSSTTVELPNGQQVTVAWFEHDHLHAADAATRDLEAMRSRGAARHFSRQGRVVIEAYTDFGDPALAAETLTQILGE